MDGWPKIQIIQQRLPARSTEASLPDGLNNKVAKAIALLKKNKTKTKLIGEKHERNS